VSQMSAMKGIKFRQLTAEDISENHELQGLANSHTSAINGGYVTVPIPRTILSESVSLTNSQDSGWV
jgi:hypothetical protein